MTATVPMAIVLIVCKTALTGEIDPNAGFTKHEPRKWAIEDSMMVCRRLVMPIYDTALDKGASPVNPNLFDRSVCARIGIPIGVQWDQEHKSSAYRFWKIGCPTPIIDTQTGKYLGFKLPECGNRDVVKCDVDSEI